jgi:hypothetical protein
VTRANAADPRGGDPALALRCTTTHLGDVRIVTIRSSRRAGRRTDRASGAVTCDTDDEEAAMQDITKHEQAMLKAHPRGVAFEESALLACLQACLDCAQTCGACADACLAEPDPRPLRKCIRLNLDCAALCAAAAEIITRQTDPERTVVNAAVDACGIACIACAEECERHGEDMEHCRICAEACRTCADACSRMLGRTAQA